MKITATEETMYRVMKAIYDNGIPIDFKGSMVLKAFLTEVGFSSDTRHTKDIDANWYSSTSPTAEQIRESLQKALNDNDIDLDISIYRMYGEGKSAGFELADKNTSDVLFSMDIDVNRPKTPSKIYEIKDFKFRGVTPSQMLADKITAISTDRVFRRIKDIIDLYYFSMVFDFNDADVKKILADSGRVLGSFDGFLYRTSELKHAYDKFRFSGDVEKPEFDEVYRDVKKYIKSVLP